MLVMTKDTILNRFVVGLIVIWACWYDHVVESCICCEISESAGQLWKQYDVFADDMLLVNMISEQT